MPIELKVPQVGESITEVVIGEWLKSEGAKVARDENVAVIETEKATVELPAPEAGILTKLLKAKGETARVGEVIAHMEREGQENKDPSPPEPVTAMAQSKGEAPSKQEAPTKQETPPKGETRVMPAAERLIAQRGLNTDAVKAIKGTGPGGRVLKEDVQEHEKPRTEVPKPESTGQQEWREEVKEPMSLLRRKVAERLLDAQKTAALLTTFNEIDMTAAMELRKRHQDSFQKAHGVKLGFMSFFVKACVDALRRIPELNAEIRGTDIVYRNYYDIGVAIGGGKGLVVPVLRNAERMGFAEVEKTISEFAARAKDNRLKPDDLQGGTFTITNGGVYGSLLSTPIVNPPQSGILGMHAIQERPVAREGQVVIRSMMYVALTYDHRLVDGREAVTFLKRIKDTMEDPTRLVLEV